ncbi:MAG: hypothetical protein WCS42_15150 [Verrucomicrobiota bacterium]
METTLANPMLPDAEWAFHEVDPNERHACFLHERSRGVAPGQILYWHQKPWRDLEPNEKRFLVDLLPPPNFRRRSVRRGNQSKDESDLEKIGGQLQRYAERLALRSGVEWKLPVETIIMEFDWRTSDTKLQEDFAKFIQKERLSPLSAASQYKQVARTTGTGRKRDVDRFLVDIAIARAAAAGYARLGVVKLLKDLLQSCNLLGPEWEAKDGLFSEKNWASTLKKARAVFNP